VKLVRESDDDVSDASFAANSVLHSVEAKNGDRARTDQDEDAIRQADCPSKGLALQWSVPGLELELTRRTHHADCVRRWRGG